MQPEARFVVIAAMYGILSVQDEAGQSGAEPRVVTVPEGGVSQALRQAFAPPYERVDRSWEALLARLR
jgi:hypothetical protein